MPANKTIMTEGSFGAFCDRSIIFSLCALIFVLPASIALLDSFAALAVFFYLLKKINRIVVDWSSTFNLNLLGKIRFIWKGLAPAVNFFNLPLQFLILAVFISVLFSQYPAHSLYAFFGKFVKYVFLYFSFIEAFNTERRIRFFLAFFFASVFITVLMGEYGHITGHGFFKWHLVAGGRVNSFFNTGNGLGVYLLLPIGLVSHFLFAVISRKKSWILAGALALFLALLLACLRWTYSRSAWVGFLVVLFAMALIDRRKLLFMGVLSMIFIFIFLPSLSQVRNLCLFNDNSSGARNHNGGLVYSIKPNLKDVGSGRTIYWKQAILIIRSSPIYGTGLNTFLKILERDSKSKAVWYAHNSYLQMMAESGIIGLGCFLWMLYVLLTHGLNSCKYIKHWWPLTMLQGALSGLFGFLVQSFFDNTFFSVQLSVLMWLVFGLVAALTRLVEV